MYRTIVGNTGTAIMFVDDGTIVYASTEFETCFGHPRTSLVGQIFWDYLPDESDIGSG